MFLLKYFNNILFNLSINPLSAGVFSKIVPILPKLIKTSNDDITRNRPIWTLDLG